MWTWARWIVVVPVGVAAWVSTFFVGITTLSWVMRLHPSGLSSDLVVHAFVALSAILIVASAALVAPSHKSTTAWVAFVLGSSAATVLLALTDLTTAFLAAEAAGLVTATVVHAWRTRRTRSSPR